MRRIYLGSGGKRKSMPESVESMDSVKSQVSEIKSAIVSGEVGPTETEELLRRLGGVKTSLEEMMASGEDVSQELAIIRSAYYTMDEAAWEKDDDEVRSEYVSEVEGDLRRFLQVYSDE
jgi:hypothetical protein